MGIQSTTKRLQVSSQAKTDSLERWTDCWDDWLLIIYLSESVKWFVDKISEISIKAGKNISKKKILDLVRVLYV